MASETAYTRASLALFCLFFVLVVAVVLFLAIERARRARRPSFREMIDAERARQDGAAAANLPSSTPRRRVRWAAAAEATPPPPSAVNDAPAAERDVERGAENQEQEEAFRLDVPSADAARLAFSAIANQETRI